MKSKLLIPEKSYGVLNQDKFSNDLDDIAEQVRRLGYAVMDSGESRKLIK